MPPHQHGPKRHPHGAPQRHEHPQHPLLPARQRAQINRIEPRVRHGRDDQEQAVDVADIFAVLDVRGDPEHNGEEEAQEDEIDVVKGDEVEWRQPGSEVID